MGTETPSNAQAAARSARALLHSGQIEKAADFLAGMITAHPAEPDFLGLLGIARMKQGSPVQAEALLRRAVEAGAGATRLRYLNALAALFLGTGRKDDAQQVLARHLAQTPSLPTDPRECGILCSLANCLLATGDVDGARRIASVVAASPLAEDPGTMPEATVLLARLRDGSTARALIERAETVPPRDLLLQLGAIAVEQGDAQLRQFAAERVARHHPAFIDRRPDDDRLRVLVLNWIPQFGAADAFACYNATNTIGAFALGDARKRFAFDVLLCRDPAAVAGARLPAPDLVFNNIATAELPLLTGGVQHVEDAARRFGAPVLNEPRAVACTSREQNHDRLRNIAGLRFPATAVFSRDGQPDELLADSILLQFGRPVILRKMLGQSGSGVHLCRDRADVVGALRRLDGFFYAIEYIDCAVRPGLWRKFRLACIGDRLLGHKLSYGEDWLVNASRWKRLGAGRPDLQAEEERFLADPFGYVGPAAERALREVRARTPLDFFGIDFALDRDGQVVVFEVNAAMRMLPHGRTRSRFPYLDANRARIRDAFEALLLARAGAHRSSVTPQ